jgi:serine/threonine protein kinase
MGNNYSYEVDYWAMGILLHELLTGSPPFTGNNNRIISDRIIKTKLKLPYYLSPDAKDIITKLLKKVPAARIGSKEGDIQKIKSHRFFRKIDWKKLETRELEPPIQPVITDPAEAENFPRFNALPLPSSPPAAFSGRDIQGRNDGGVTVASGSVGGSFGSSLFQGFTYTASSSFIDRFLRK